MFYQDQTTVSPFETEHTEQDLPPPQHLDAQGIASRLKSCVPLCELLGFEINEVNSEQAICSIPATPLALNQNGTYQASTFYILADYTAGLAAYAALPGYSLLGLNEIPGLPLLQGWLKSGTVKHIRPATGKIRATCSIPPSDCQTMLQALQSTGKATYTGEVLIHQGETLTAIGTHTVVFKLLG